MVNSDIINCGICRWIPGLQHDIMETKLNSYLRATISKDKFIHQSKMRRKPLPILLVDLHDLKSIL